MTSRLRVAVVGVGYLGRHHARLLASMEHVQLTGVVDIKPDRALEVGSTYGVPGVTDPSELPVDSIDAVSIAVPTSVHFDVALPFLERRIPTLVEKPLAATVEEADRLIAAADRSDTALAVGHTERFNPAVVAALPLLTHPRFVEVHRLGAFPERSLDIDVIFDLMIHDLDLLLTAVSSDVLDVEAIGVNVLTPKTDIANARLRFASGCVANVTASRISREKVRKVRFWQRDSYVSIDFASQEVEAYRLKTANAESTIVGGRIDVTRDEPLRAELADFVDAVRLRRPPGVDGRAGRAALALATQVAAAMETSA